MHKDLYYSEANKSYYFTNIEPCATCHRLIEHAVLIKKVFSKNQSLKLEFYCLPCSNKTKKNIAFYQEKFIAAVTDKLPRDAIPVLGGIPNLVPSNSGFLECNNKKKDLKEGTVVSDKTIAVHDPKFMIQSDAKVTAQLEHMRIVPALPDLSDEEYKSLMDPENMISVEELDNLLDSYANAKPVLLDVEKKPMLEDHAEVKF